MDEYSSTRRLCAALSPSPARAIVVAPICSHHRACRRARLFSTPSLLSRDGVPAAAPHTDAPARRNCRSLVACAERSSGGIAFKHEH
jgi:hypothetical protein